jgi:16S rRNA (cytidine1402-2'-O)-methyltransferase
MTARAVQWLKEADLVACEDTRVSGRLLKHFGIDRPMLAYHDHNAGKMRPLILERLKAGERVALVSDAGTPLINDPGYKLTSAAIAAGIDVTVLPGASAVLSALLLSGLPSDRFLYAGFLAPKSAARRRELAELAGIGATLVFFETAPRLAAALGDMAAILGDRKAAIVREITKLFEQARRGRLADLAREIEASGPLKGRSDRGRPARRRRAPTSTSTPHCRALKQGTSGTRSASRYLTGFPRRAVYERVSRSAQARP